MSVLEMDLDEIRVPVSTTGPVEFLRLKEGQKQALTGVELKRIQEEYEESPSPTSKRALVANAPGTGKTIVFCLLAINDIQRTGRPALYSADEISSLDHTEKEFIRTFRHHMGRDPIIHRHGENGHIDEGTPDLVMGTPQFYSTFETPEGHSHPDFDIQYCHVGIDEADKWVTQKRRALIDSIRFDWLTAFAGTLDRTDDPEDGHLIYGVFGEPASIYLTEDALARGEINEPEYILHGTNIKPLLHEIFQGKIKLDEINKTYTSKNLNKQYMRVFLQHYTELKKPQTVFYCQSIAHLEQMEKLMRAEGLDVFPIHSRMTKKERQENLQKFEEKPDGGIALAVNMLRRSVNLHNLGLIMETAETNSVSKFTQTLGRGVRAKNVRFVDLTMSLKHIQHIRLFAQRVQNAYRRALGLSPTEPHDIDLPGVKIHASVNELIQEMIDIGLIDPDVDVLTITDFKAILRLTDMKKEFLFALRATAAARLLAQEKSHPANMVSLEEGTDIELENGTFVRLQYDEKVNVRTWFKGLPRDHEGNLDLSPEQMALLNKLEIDINRLAELFSTRQRKRNGEDTKTLTDTKVRSTKEQKGAAENYFASDDFWLGLYAFRHSHDVLPIANILDPDPSAPSYQASVDPQKVGRGFRMLEELPPVKVETLEGKPRTVSMQKWLEETKEHFPHATNEIKLGLFREGITFGDPLFREVVARSYLIQVDADRPGRSKKTHIDELSSVYMIYDQGDFEVVILPQGPEADLFTRIHFVNLPGVQMRLPGIAKVSYQDILHYRALPSPSDEYFALFDIRSTQAERIDRHKEAARSFEESDYFWIGIEQLNRFTHWHNKGQLGQHIIESRPGITTLLQGSEVIPRLWTRLAAPLGDLAFLIRDTTGLALEHDDPHTFPFDLRQWIKDIEPLVPFLSSENRYRLEVKLHALLHSPFRKSDLSSETESRLAEFDDDLKRLAESLSSRKRASNAPKRNPRTADAQKARDWFESNSFWIGLHGFRMSYSRPNRGIENVLREYPELRKIREDVSPRHGIPDFVDYDGQLHWTKVQTGGPKRNVDMITWLKKCWQLYPFANKETRDGLFREGITFGNPLFKELLVRSFIYESQGNGEQETKGITATHLPPHISLSDQGRGFRVSLFLGKYKSVDQAAEIVVSPYLHLPPMRITTNGTAVLSYQDILHYRALTLPSTEYFEFFGENRAARIDPINRLNDEAHSFRRSDYFWIGMQQLLLHKTDLPPRGRVLLLSPDEMFPLFIDNVFPHDFRRADRAPDSADVSFIRHTTGIELDDDDQHTFPFDIHRWAEDMKPLMPFFDRELKLELIQRLHHSGLDDFINLDKPMVSPLGQMLVQ